MIVRTAAGARRYGVPIGTVIPRGHRKKKGQNKATKQEQPKDKVVYVGVHSHNKGTPSVVKTDKKGKPLKVKKIVIKAKRTSTKKKTSVKKASVRSRKKRK